jgi:hypothetical protein
MNAEMYQLKVIQREQKDKMKEIAKLVQKLVNDRDSAQADIKEAFFVIRKTHENWLSQRDYIKKLNLYLLKAEAAFNIAEEDEANARADFDKIARKLFITKKRILQEEIRSRDQALLWNEKIELVRSTVKEIFIYNPKIGYELLSDLSNDS